MAKIEAAIVLPCPATRNFYSVAVDELKSHGWTLVADGDDLRLKKAIEASTLGDAYGKAKWNAVHSLGPAHWCHHCGNWTWLVYVDPSGESD